MPYMLPICYPYPYAPWVNVPYPAAITLVEPVASSREAWRPLRQTLKPQKIPNGFFFREIGG